MTVKHIQSRTANQLSRSLNKDCILYAHASYNVEFLLLYMGFDPVSSKISHGTVYTIESREHVGEIERER